MVVALIVLSLWAVLASCLLVWNGNRLNSHIDFLRTAHKSEVNKLLQQYSELNSAWSELIGQSTGVVGRMMSLVEKAGGPIDPLVLPDLEFYYRTSPLEDIRSIDDSSFTRSPGIACKQGKLRRYRFETWVFVPSEQEAPSEKRSAILYAALVGHGAKVFADAAKQEINRAFA